MIYHISALALIILVLGLAAVRRRSLYSPLVISASIWLIVFIVGLIFEKRLYPIQESAFSAWLIWFIVTSMIFFLFIHPMRRSRGQRQKLEEFLWIIQYLYYY